MKQNLLKVLLLSMMTVSLVACGETSSEPSSEPSTPSVEESSTPTQEEISSSEEVEDEHPAVIELSRRIFIEGEDVKPYVTRFDMWSPILGGYKPKLDNFRVVMPETCPNGEAKVTLVSGKERAEVTIYYYTDVETAVANTQIEVPEDTSKIFKESDYIDKKGELTFDTFTEEGTLYASVDSIKAIQANKMPEVTWATQTINVWNDPTKMVKSVYDETKTTLPHFVDGSNNHYNTTMAFTFDTEQMSSVSSAISFEIISDAEGNVLYFAPIKYTQGSWPNLATGEGYWSSIKDYKENPVFVFADDYNEETNPHAYQKVMPEGGSWIIGFNNRGTATYIDRLWNDVTGLKDTLINNYSSYFNITMEDEALETALMNAKVKGTLDGRYLSAIVYKVADTYQRYAYYAVKAEESGDETKKSYRASIKEAIIMQQLPAVKAEPVLFEYYESVTTDKLDEWAALFTE